MNSPLILDGKKFITSRQAAKKTGYASDYIGQLCRSGKLSCRRIGKGWFVEEDSLHSYKALELNHNPAKAVRFKSHGMKLENVAPSSIPEAVENVVAPTLVLAAEDSAPVPEVSTEPAENDFVAEEAEHISFENIARIADAHDPLVFKDVVAPSPEQVSPVSVRSEEVFPASTRTPLFKKFFTHIPSHLAVTGTPSPLASFRSSELAQKASALLVSFVVVLGGYVLTNASLLQNALPRTRAVVENVARDLTHVAKVAFAEPELFLQAFSAQAEVLASASSAMSHSLFVAGAQVGKNAGDTVVQFARRMERGIQNICARASFAVTHRADLANTLRAYASSVSERALQVALGAFTRTFSHQGDASQFAASLPSETQGSSWTTPFSNLARATYTALNSLFEQGRRYVLGDTKVEVSTPVGTAGMSSVPATPSVVIAEKPPTVSERPKSSSVITTAPPTTPPVYIERVVERPVIYTTGGLSSLEVDQRLSAFMGKLSADIALLRGEVNQNPQTTTGNTTYLNQVYQTQALGSRLDRIQDVALLNPTITDGTATNLVIGGNSSSFSGNSGTFASNLTVGGSSTITGNLIVYGTLTPSVISATSSISAPYFTATSTTATSTFAGGLAVQTDKFVVQQGSGNVGIGTSTPATFLHIGSTTTPSYLFDSATEGGILLAPNVSAARLAIQGSGQGDIILIHSGAATDLKAMQLITIGGLTKFRSVTDAGGLKADNIIVMDNSTGNVGFGTAAPTALLHISTTTPGMDVFKVTAGSQNLVYNSSGYVGIGTSTPWGQLSVNPNGLSSGVPEFVIGSSSATHLILTTDGKLGLGGITSNLNSTLHIVGEMTVDRYSTDTGSTAFNFRKARGTLASPSDISVGDMLFQISPRGYKNSAFRTAGSFNSITDAVGASSVDAAWQWTTSVGGGADTEKMRLSSAGFLGIGTTSPYAALSVVGQIVGSYFTATSTTATSTFSTGGLAVGTSTPFGNGLFTVGTSTPLFYVDRTNGRVGVGTAAPGAQLEVKGISTTRLHLMAGNSSGYGILGAYNEDSTTELDVLQYGSTAVGTTAGIANANNSFIEGAPISAMVVGTANANPLYFETNRVIGMTLLSGGKVGIGTTTPQAKLHIAGSASTFGLAGMEFEDTSGNSNARNWTVGNGLGPYGSFDFSVGSALGATPTSAGIKLSLNSNGNLGIGTTTPYAKLSISNAYTDTANTPLLAIASTTGGTATSTLFTVLASGNVGIGTVSPHLKLEVVGTNAAESGTATPNGGLLVGDGATSNTQILSMGVLDGTNNHAWIQSRNLTTTGTYALALNPSGGNVGIGTTTPRSILDVYTDTKYFNVGIDSTYGAGAIISGSGGTSLISNNIYFTTTGSALANVNSSKSGAFLEFANQDTYFTRSSSGSGPTRSESMFIQGSTGNVGIGTTTPGQKLSVAGDILGNNIIGSYFTATSTTATSTFAGGFSAAGSSGLSVLQNGNVGIGTANPETKLQVGGSLLVDTFAIGGANGTTGIFFRSGFTASNQYNVSITTYDHSGNTATDGLSINGNDGVSFSTGSNSRNERMRVDINGNVGIGTTTPSSLLSVHGTGYISSSLFVGGAITGTSTLNITGLTTLGNASTTQIGSTGSAYFATASGNVGIGTTTPANYANTGGMLDITGTNNPGVTIHSSGQELSLITNNGAGAYLDVSGASTASNNFLSFRTSNSASSYSLTERMRVTSAGNLGIGTTSPGTTLGVQGRGLFADSVNASTFQATSTTATSTLQALSTTNFANTAMTAGSIPFFGAGGYMNQNNANLFWDSANARLGVGTAGPGNFLEVSGTNFNYRSRTPNSFLDFGIESGRSNYGFGVRNAANAITFAVDSTGGIVAGSYAATANQNPPNAGMIISGSVGIGTTSPGTTLGVQGRGLFADSVNASTFQATSTTATSTVSGYLSTAQFANTAMTAGSIPFFGAGGYMNQNNANLFWDNTNNRLGIGTTTPGSKLMSYVAAGSTVGAISESSLALASNGSLNSNSQITFGYQPAQGYAPAYINYVTDSATAFTNGHLAFGTRSGTTDSQPSEVMRITSTGNVGIGTTSPMGTLDVYNAANLGAIVLSSGYNAGVSSNSNWAIKQSGYNYGDLAFVESNTTGGNPVTAGTSRLLIQKITGNVGIGTTSPANLLSVAGNLSLGNGNYIGFVPGTAITTSNYSLYGDTTNTILNARSGAVVRLRQNNTDQFTLDGSTDILYTSGSERMRIDSSGNVGIGTTTPTVPLTVAGDVVLGASGAGVTLLDYGRLNIGIASNNALGLVIGDNATPTNAPDVYLRATSNTARIYTAGAKLSLGTTALGAANLMIDGSGNVGIGTTTPNNLLSVYSATKSALEFSGSTAGSWTMGYDVSNNRFSIASSTALGTTDRLVINSQGNVGIGTAAPGFKLEVDGAGGTVGQTPIGAFLETTSGNKTRVTFTADANGAYVGSDALTTYQRLGFHTSQTERLTILAAGNVGIGTTSPVSKLSVLGESAFAGGASVGIGYAGTAAPTGGMIIQGNVGIGTTSPGTTLGVQGRGLFADSVNASIFIATSTTATSTFSTGGLTVGTSQFVVQQNSGNVGIGTAGPATLLTVNGAASATQLNVGAFTATDYGSGLQVTTANGVQTNFRLSQTGAINWDFVIPASTSRLDFMSGGVARVTFLNSGNVGIGTTTPSSLLSVQGTGYISSSLFVGGAITATSTLNVTGLTTLGNASTTQISSTGSAYFATASGNVGIGTTSPYKTFASVAPANGGAVFSAPGTSDLIVADSNGAQSAGYSLRAGNGSATDFAIFDMKQGSAALTILAGSGGNGGNVGIGTTSPLFKLDVSGLTLSTPQIRTTATTNSGIRIDGDGSSPASRNWAMLSNNLAYGDFSIKTSDAILGDPLAAGTSRLYINPSGNVGIGTTSPWRVLSVQGSVALNGLTTAVGTPSALCLQAGGEVQVNTGVATCTVSSARFKHDITTSTVGLAEIMRLRPVTFVYNGSNGSTHYGLIAEEVQAVDPRLVAYEADGVTPRSVHYEEFTVVLTKAVQEIGSVIDLTNATTSAASILIDAAGNVGIGTSTPEYKLQIMGDVAATSFVNISTRTAKKDIKYLTDDDKRSISERIRNIKVATYTYLNEPSCQSGISNSPNSLISNGKTCASRLGLIAEEAPLEVLSASGKGVDVYKLSTFILAGVQEQQKRLEGLEMRIVAMESLLASSTPQQGAWFSVASVATAVKDLIASGGEWVVSKITAAVGDFGTAKVENGLEMKDSATGATYCVRITNGEFAKSAGGCDTAGATATSASGSSTSDNIGTGAPIFTMNGNNPAEIATGTNYSDLGVMVIDPVTMNDLSYRVFMNGGLVGQVSLDTSSSTTYTIDYVATTQAGVTATTTRTVIVDVEQPSAEISGESSTAETATSTSPTGDSATTTPAVESATGVEATSALGSSTPQTE